MSLNRGFKMMSKEDRIRIASLGGRAAHAKGVAHEWTREEAVEAGRKGGSVMRKRKREAKGG